MKYETLFQKVGRRLYWGTIRVLYLIFCYSSKMWSFNSNLLNIHVSRVPVHKVLTQMFRTLTLKHKLLGLDSFIYISHSLFHYFFDMRLQLTCDIQTTTPLFIDKINQLS